MKFLSSILAASILATSSAKVVKLNDENFKKLTTGKEVFIKFYAPWCGYCKAIKADWERLGDDWTDNEVGLIGAVDCTAEDSEVLCTDIESFPTIKYGEPEHLELYDGPTKYDDFAEFAKENLKPSCSFERMELCDEETKAEIDKFEKMEYEDLDKIFEAIHSEVDKMEEAATEKIQELEAQINAHIEQYNRDSHKMKKEKNYKFLVQVMKNKAPERFKHNEDGEFSGDFEDYGDFNDEDQAEF